MCKAAGTFWSCGCGPVYTETAKVIDVCEKFLLKWAYDPSCQFEFVEKTSLGYPCLKCIGYQCQYLGCVKSFPEKRLPQYHVEGDHEVGTYRHRCIYPGCEMTFPNEFILRGHLDCEHPGTYNPSNNDSGSHSLMEDSSTNCGRTEMLDDTFVTTENLAFTTYDVYHPIKQPTGSRLDPRSEGDYCSWEDQGKSKSNRKHYIESDDTQRQKRMRRPREKVKGDDSHHRTRLDFHELLSENYSIATANNVAHRTDSEYKPEGTWDTTLRQTSELFDCPIAGCNRTGIKGYKANRHLNHHILKKHRIAKEASEEPNVATVLYDCLVMGCDSIGQGRFGDRAKRDQHMRLVHNQANEVKAFSCTIPGCYRVGKSGFDSKVKRDIHAASDRMHTQLRVLCEGKNVLLYCCPIKGCRRVGKNGFTQSNNCTRHVLLVHGGRVKGIPEAKKRFGCLVASCDRKGDLGFTLKQHRNEHMNKSHMEQFEEIKTLRDEETQREGHNRRKERKGLKEHREDGEDEICEETNQCKERRGQQISDKRGRGGERKRRRDTNDGKEDEGFKRRRGVEENEVYREQGTLRDIEAFDCPVVGCYRKGKEGYKRKDSLVDHVRRIYGPQSGPLFPRIETSRINTRNRKQ